MPIITHTFVSGKAEQSDPSIIGPNEWNAVHTVSASQYFTATAGQTTFTPTTQPTATSWVFLNGVKMRNGSSFDWTVVSTNIVFNYALMAGAIVEVIP